MGAGDAVRRMLVRAFAGFLAAALTWAERAVEIVRIGQVDADAMERIASEVRGEVETIAADLRGVARQRRRCRRLAHGRPVVARGHAGAVRERAALARARAAGRSA